MIFIIIYFLIPFGIFLSLHLSSYNKLKKIDALITEFKARNYPTVEEREKAKEELKTKLLIMKENMYVYSHSYRSSATKKILGL